MRPIQFEFYDTCYGTALIASDRDRICLIAYPGTENYSDEYAKNELTGRFGAVDIQREVQPVHQKAADAIGRPDVEIALICNPEDASEPGKLPVLVSGTSFQMAVWAELCRIPFGERRTYGQLSELIGHPKAHRATGSAIGRNPVSSLIPCHRVVRSDGQIGQYYWGTPLKKIMLQHESAQKVTNLEFSLVE
ncbi:MAG: methylated-DNA--[protein]-cysteine S-methyltransferase [Balneolales bacterium]|nr:methylated-DNA--[protein]-cysteine S-methyltransferase [Balneolales bacterium]